MDDEGLTTLTDPWVFTEFAVSVESDSARTYLTTLGQIADDNDHVFVSSPALATLAGENYADPKWRHQLEGMIKFATKRGWVDEVGRVRAHVEVNAAT